MILVLMAIAEQVTSISPELKEFYQTGFYTASLFEESKIGSIYDHKAFAQVRLNLLHYHAGILERPRLEDIESLPNRTDFESLIEKAAQDPLIGFFETIVSELEARDLSAAKYLLFETTNVLARQNPSALVPYLRLALQQIQEVLEKEFIQPN